MSKEGIIGLIYKAWYIKTEITFIGRLIYSIIIILSQHFQYAGICFNIVRHLEGPARFDHGLVKHEYIHGFFPVKAWNSP